MGGVLSEDVLLQELGRREHFATGQACLQALVICAASRWSPYYGRSRQGQKLLISAVASIGGGGDIFGVARSSHCHA